MPTTEDVSTMTRPNLLVIMTDEHNASVTGCYGNEIVRTPHLDGLAGRGITFDACYCNSPLCVPSRQSFTGGKYVSRIGTWNNHTVLPPDAPSLPRVMNEAGYESVLCGKQHYEQGNYYGFNALVGRYKDKDGNDREFPFNTHGGMNGKGGRRAPDDLSDKGLSSRFSEKELRVGDDSGVLFRDALVTRETVRFLQERGRGDKPFFLFTGYLAPHFPLIVPEAYWLPYKDNVPMPEIPPGHLESQPLNYRHHRAGFGTTNVPDEIVKRAREIYYGMTQWVDEEIGKVLQALENSAAGDNTVVIYTSDHGENLGEHGLWWKNTMYEQAARVPLIVSWPARWTGGQRRTQACSLVDLVQTIAALGGAETPGDWDGDSLLPWLDDPKAGWKDQAVVEYYSHPIASGFSMIRQGPWKYVYHTAPGEGFGPERELYDLQSDPGEFRNLAALPEHATRIAQMHAALVRELGEEPDATEARCRADFARARLSD